MLIINWNLFRKGFIKIMEINTGMMIDESNLYNDRYHRAAGGPYAPHGPWATALTAPGLTASQVGANNLTTSSSH